VVKCEFGMVQGEGNCNYCTHARNEQDRIGHGLVTVLECIEKMANRAYFESVQIIHRHNGLPEFVDDGSIMFNFQPW
jgi:hypothetical protein